MTQRIALGGEHGAGLFAVVDDHRAEQVAGYSWYLAVSRYGKPSAVEAYVPGSGRRNHRHIKLHQLITGQRGIDHRDGDPLNNTDGNLRPATNAQNQHNTGPRGGSSTYKGVCWHPASGKWMARLRVSGRGVYLGLFAVEEDAARAYDAAARELHGAFAWLNFPP